MLTVLAQSQRSNVQEAVEGNNTDLKYHTRGCGDDVDGKELFYGLYMPWKVTGDMMSTSARAISDRSLALRIRQYVGLWAPGHTTMVSSTPVQHFTTLTTTSLRLKHCFSPVILLLTQHTTRHMQISSVCSFIHSFLHFFFY